MNAEINLNDYSIIRNGRNRNGGDVPCYIRNDLCFNINIFFSNSYEHAFFFFLNSHPKVKPIALGIFNRPPQANHFLDTFLNCFHQIDNKTN